MLPVRVAACLLAVVALGPWPARAETGAIRSVNEGGRRLYVNGNRAAGRKEARLAPPRITKQRTLASAKIKNYADRIAEAYSIRPELVQAVIAVESGWDPLARSKKGALGLMQLMPETCLRFGVLDPFEPQENIRAGIQYLRLLLDRFDGDVRLALAAYNAGEKAIEAEERVPPYQETQDYIQRVNETYGRLAGTRLFSSEEIYSTRDYEGRTVFTNY